MAVFVFASRAITVFVDRVVVRSPEPGDKERGSVQVVVATQDKPRGGKSGSRFLFYVVKARPLEDALQIGNSD